jgi:hypothetical protein
MGKVKEFDSAVNYCKANGNKVIDTASDNAACKSWLKICS